MSYNHLLPSENYKKTNVPPLVSVGPEKTELISTVLEFGVSICDIFSSVKNGLKEIWKDTTNDVR